MEYIDTSNIISRASIYVCNGVCCCIACAHACGGGLVLPTRPCTGAYAHLRGSLHIMARSIYSYMLIFIQSNIATYHMQQHIHRKSSKIRITKVDAYMRARVWPRVPASARPCVCVCACVCGHGCLCVRAMRVRTYVSLYKQLLTGPIYNLRAYPMHTRVFVCACCRYGCTLHACECDARSLSGHPC